MALSLGSSCLTVKVLEDNSVHRKLVMFQVQGALKGMVGMGEPSLVSADTSTQSHSSHQEYYLGTGTSHPSQSWQLSWKLCNFGPVGAIWQREKGKEMRNEKWWEIAPVYLGAGYGGRAAQRRAAGTWHGCSSSRCCLPRSLLCMYSALGPPYLQQPCGCFIAAAIKERGPQGWLALVLSKDTLRFVQRQPSSGPL